MLTRWLSALIGIPLFIGVCYWSDLAFAVGILCVAALGLAEIVKTYHAQSIRPNLLIAGLGLVGPAWVLATTASLEREFFGLVLMAGLLALLVEVMQAARTGQMHVARNTAYGLLCAVYVTLFGGLSALRDWGGVAVHGSFPRAQGGFLLVIVVASCVWATDSAALFVGKAVGKRKLAPLLSPGKTVEGSLGGLAGGVLIGLVFGRWLLGSLPLGFAIGVTAGVFGQVGDLFESALKREAGIKDFGRVVPGHGGVLDRFDSLLFVAPLVWLLLQVWGRM